MNEIHTVDKPGIASSQSNYLDLINVNITVSQDFQLFAPMAISVLSDRVPRSIQAGVSTTLAPFKLQAVRATLSVHGLSSLLPTFANLCINLTVVYPASVSAYCCPMHTLGPPLKGRYSHVGRICSHRSGLNSSASEPKYSGRRCIAHTE